MIEYTCVECGRVFEHKKLRADARVVCEPCRDEARKASKRETWRKHGETYRQRARQAPRKPIHKPAQKPAQVEAVPELPEEDVGRPVDWKLPNGQRVVWMAYHLS